MKKLKFPIIIWVIDNSKILQMWHIFMTYWINGRPRQVKVVIWDQFVVISSHIKQVVSLDRFK